MDLPKTAYFGVRCGRGALFMFPGDSVIHFYVCYSSRYVRFSLCSCSAVRDVAKNAPRSGLLGPKMLGSFM